MYHALSAITSPRIKITVLYQLPINTGCALAYVEPYLNKIHTTFNIGLYPTGGNLFLKKPEFGNLDRILNDKIIRIRNKCYVEFK